jgi:hypothetical protein
LGLARHMGANRARGKCRSVRQYRYSAQRANSKSGAKATDPGQMEAPYVKTSRLCWNR